MYSQSDIEKKERRRIITISVAVIALILVLLIAIIVTATNKSNRSDVSKQVNSEYTIDSADESKTNADANKEESKAETSKPVEKAETKKSESKPVVDSSVATNDAKDMPSTGPEELLPLALVLGMSTTCIASYVLAKRNA